MKPSPQLLQALSRSKLHIAGAQGTPGAGERRSTEKGSGIEFIDYRPYEVGDDLRHLDIALYARHGDYTVRQYATYKPALVTVLLDASASMLFGEPRKFDFAATLAHLLAFVGLAGGDVVQMAVWSRDRLNWSPRVSGIGRNAILADWLDGQQTGGRDFQEAFGLVMRSGRHSHLIAISDWLGEDVDASLPAVPPGKSVLAVQVSARQEEDPDFSGESDLTLTDAETGLAMDLTIDRSAIEDYREQYRQWRDGLRHRLLKAGYGHVAVRSDADMNRIFQSDWRRLGIIQ